MATVSGTSETEIWARVIQPERGVMPPEAARFFLDLQFDAADLRRMHELVQKNQQGALTADEADALNNFRKVGLQMDLLRSKARLALRNHDRS